MELEQHQYPLGKWVPKKKITAREIARNIAIIAIIEKYLAKYRRLVKKLLEDELSKSYREGAWNVRQLVVHISDMHILHYVRFKQELYKPNPVGFLAKINEWNAMSEVANANMADAVMPLEATHKHWVHLMKSMPKEYFKRTFFYSLRQISLTLEQALALAAWLVRHHFEHIKIAIAS